MGLQLIDSHAHLVSKAFAADRDAVIDRARMAGVEAIVEAGTDLGSSKAAVLLASEQDLVHAAVGVHPHSASGVNGETLSQLEVLARKPKVVAIGEIGLDYYRDLSPRAAQRSAFARQLELAENLDLPVIVHCRDAIDDVLQDLRGWGGRAVLHSFLSGLERLEDVVQLGLFIGVSGPVTYADADDVRLLARDAPLDKLLIETDCPYLSPVPHRRERNEPAYVQHVVEALARARGIGVDTIARCTTQNARTLFGIP